MAQALEDHNLRVQVVLEFLVKLAHVHGLDSNQSLDTSSILWLC